MKLTRTDNFDNAVKLASNILGHHFYECYENVEKKEFDFHDANNTEDFFVSPDGRIFYIYKKNEERIFDEVTIGSIISSQPLSVVKIEEDGRFWVFSENALSKSDRKARMAFSKYANAFFKDKLWALTDINLERVA